MQRRVSFKAGGRPKKIVLYEAGTTGRASEGKIDRTIKTCEYSEYEHLVSDQQLSGAVLHEPQKSSVVSVTSPDPGEAERIIDAIISERAPLAEAEYLRRQERTAQREAAEKTRLRKKAEAAERRRLRRSLRLGLAEDHQGPIDPAERKRWREDLLRRQVEQIGRRHSKTR